MRKVGISLRIPIVGHMRSCKEWDSDKSQWHLSRNSINSNILFPTWDWDIVKTRGVCNLGGVRTPQSDYVVIVPSRDPKGCFSWAKKLNFSIWGQFYWKVKLTPHPEEHERHVNSSQSETLSYWHLTWSSIVYSHCIFLHFRLFEVNLNQLLETKGVTTVFPILMYRTIDDLYAVLNFNEALCCEVAPVAPFSKGLNF